MGKKVGFKHAPTLKRALRSSASVKIVQGPVESGKTVWMVMDIYKEMCTIPRCTDGIRRSKFLVVRSTDGELQRGIIKTWKQWFPEDVHGPLVGTMPTVHTLKFLDVECEVEFFAFEDDSEAVLKKLRSTEYTKAYVNEGQFTKFALFLAIRQRTGRYPSKIDCPDWDRKKRICMDMNAARTNDHWVLYIRGDIPFPPEMSPEQRRAYTKPDDWEFFVQPPAVRGIYDEKGYITDFEIHPDIENLAFIDADEILSLCQNGAIDDIKRDYMNEMVILKAGNPRYPKFSRGWHVAKEQLQPVEGVAPIIGYDPGQASGAATFWQRVNGQWRGLFELNARLDPRIRSAEAQGERMLDILKQHFPWYKDTGVAAWMDPYGTWKSTDENTTFQSIISELGLDFQQPALKDNPSLRLQTGTKMIKAGSYGTPKMSCCPFGMPSFIVAMDGGCTMKVVKRQKDMVEENSINKNKHADIVESAEYAWWGGGEDNAIIPKIKEHQQPTRVDTFAGSIVPGRRSFVRRTGSWTR